MTLKRIYTVNLGYSGSSFSAYLMGLHPKIYSVHQPKVNTTPLLWTPKKSDVDKNVGHNLGKLWKKSPDDFFSINKDNMDSIVGLSELYNDRESYISNLMKDKSEGIYHESANNLFPLMNIYKSPDTKFIHLVREPVEWITRTLSIQNKGDYIKNIVNHRNPAFSSGTNDVECVANLWYNINSMIYDISKRNQDNWKCITLSDIREEPSVVWPNVFEFLELDPPPIDFKNINNRADKLDKVRPNDTFSLRGVKNTKKNQVKTDFSNEIYNNMKYITDRCIPLWETLKKL